VLSASASGFQDPSRYFRGLEEDVYSGSVDVSVPFRQWGGESAGLKFGAATRMTGRDFSERVFGIRPSPEVQFTGNEESYFSPENMGIVAFDSTSGAYTFGNVIADDSKARNNYNGSEDVHAAFAMVELPIVGGLKAIAGARFETTNISVASADSTLGAGRIEKSDVLPSLNLVYAVNERMNIRAAATRTLARPTFREIAPFASFDFDAGDFRIGNPGLRRTSITNLDLRWEYFPGIGEILAASVFYKDLQDPIEEAIVGGTNGQLQYQNVDHAVVAGLEVELRSTLGVIAKPLRNFAAGVNASLVESRVDIPPTELETRRAIDPEAGGTRDLQGQSPFLVNADLRFVSPQTGTNVGFYFNVFGRRLSNVSLGGAPDVYERPRPVLDLTLSQKLPARWTVKASAKNLLDSPFRKSHRFEGEDYVYQEYHYGRSITLGFSWSTSD
jgi:TonB-dependent receptor